MEENPEEVQPELEEEDPEEVEMEEEEPLWQMRKHPLHMLIQCLMVKVVTHTILVIKVEMRKEVIMLMETRRKMRMKTLAITG
jgi:hypothetical protein